MRRRREEKRGWRRRRRRRRDMRDEEERGDKKRIEKRKRLFSNKQVPRRKGGQGTSYQSGGEGGGEGVKRGCERIPERKQVETGEENENGACGFRRSVLDEDGGGGGGGGGRGRGGGGGGGGGGRGRGGGNVAGPTGEKETEAAKRNKEAHKGARANHNRRDARAKKMARGGFAG